MDDDNVHNSDCDESYHDCPAGYSYVPVICNFNLLSMKCYIV